MSQCPLRQNWTLDILLIYMVKNLTSMDIRDPGLRFLPPGVERYLVKGGGLSVITLDPNDKVEITDTEGKQKCEIIVLIKMENQTAAYWD